MTAPAPIPIFAVILAGGSGTRFWPLSRSQYPKQVLRLLGSDSMLQATVERLLPRVPLERITVVTNASQADVIRLDLYRKGWEQAHLLLEPFGRNTAMAVGLAAVMAPGVTDEDVLAVFPADHYIKEQEKFLTALEAGAAIARAGYLVTFGIRPTRPDTGYGYIKRGKPLDGHDGAFQAARFFEKPPLAQAEAFLREDDCYWNSGIFMFSRQALLDAFARHLPEVFGALNELGREGDAPSLKEVYERVPNISLDHGIMERAGRVAVVPVDMGWNDVGTWGALADLFSKDDQGNVALGRTLNLNTRDCLIYAQDRLIATVGLKDTVVVDTPDATLVCPMNRVQEVKNLVGELSRLEMVETEWPLTVERPWGRYTVMESGAGYKVKRIVVDPGQRLSLQLHHQRAEHWVVVQGTALVTIGREVRPVGANESVFVPLHTAHRLENPGSEPLAIIEVQTGAYLEEDDIVRLADDFWRQSKVQEEEDK